LFGVAFGIGCYFCMAATSVHGKGIKNTV